LELVASIVEACKVTHSYCHSQHLAESARSTPHVRELIAAIDEFILVNNKNPKPFVWTKKVEDILEKIGHCKAIIETLH
jgi:hypothetical protein